MESTYLSIIILSIGFIIMLGYLIIRIRMEGFKPVIVDLIVKAENMFEHGENREKMEWVVNTLIKIIPAPYNMFITTEGLISFIQSVFDVIKPALDNKPKEKTETQDTENN